MPKPLNLEITQLEAFNAAVHEGSFTRAAEVLELTQPSVSARIAGLEAVLGCTLFERGGRTLKLTPAGKIFLPFAERALTALGEGIEAIQQYQAGRMGSVTIATIDTPAMYMLSEPMAQFRREYPAVDFRIGFRLPAQIIDLILSGEAMLGLTGAPVWATGIHVHARFQQRVYAVAAPSHPLAQKNTPVIVSDLYHYTLYRITLNPNVTAMVENIAESARPGSGGALIYIPALMAVSLLIEGQGVAFLPENFVKKHVDRGKLVFLNIVDLPPLRDELLLFSLAERELDLPAQAFIQMIRRVWQHLLVD